MICFTRYSLGLVWGRHDIVFTHKGGIQCVLKQVNSAYLLTPNILLHAFELHPQEYTSIWTVYTSRNVDGTPFASYSIL